MAQSTNQNKTEIQYIANIAGSGYAVGDILRLSLVNVGFNAGSTWLNMTQGTVVAPNPTPLQVSTNMAVYNPIIPAKDKSARKWFVSQPNTNGSSSFLSNSVDFLAIRNTNAFPVRISSFEMAFAYASPASSATQLTQNLPYDVSLRTGVTAIGGGLAALAVTNGKTYAADSTVAGFTIPTGITGTVSPTIAAGWANIAPYASSSASGIHPGLIQPHNPKWAEGMIIPAGAVLVLTGTPGFSGPTTTAYPKFSIVLTDEL
jgi:hypothetical protein